MGVKHIFFRLTVLQSALLAGFTQAADIPAAQTTLETVEVQGHRNAARYGYIQSNGTSATATKTNTPVKNTPNSVSVITRRHLDERDPPDLPATLAYTSGISRSGYRGENTMIEASVRGIGGDLGGAGAPAYGGTELPHINGMRYYAHLEFNPYIVDHIDVLKGPASVLYGQANPGGIINIITKQPTGSNEHEIVVKTGSGRRKEAAIDIDRALNDQLSYRLIGAAKHVEWRTGSNGKQASYTLAPSFKWQNDRTRFTLSALYENSPKAGERNFLPRKGTVDAYSDGTRIDRNFFAGDPAFNEHRNRKLRIGYAFEHQVNSHLTLSQDAAWGRYRNKMSVLAALEGARWTQDRPWGPGLRSRAVADGLLGSGEKDIYRESTVWNTHWREFQLDNRATWQFATGRLNHTLLTGLDYYDGREQFDRWEGTTQRGINSAKPVYGATVEPFRQSHNRTTGIRQLGLYLHDQMQWGGLNLQIGGRYDRARTTYTDPLAYSNRSQKLSDGRFTWRAGALYRLPHGLAPYFSYSTSFVPAVGIDNDGRALKPTTARQAEIGLKYTPAEHVMLTASLFDIRQRNLATYDAGSQVQQPDGSFSSGYATTGKARIRGAEIELQGDITPAWGISGSYTYLNQKVLEAAFDTNNNDTTRGKTHWGLPRHSASLWSDYRFRRGSLRGFSIGTGIRYQSKTWGNNFNTFRVPAYALWDLKLAYRAGERFKALRGTNIQLNIQNLTDKKYVASCADDFACFYGTGRRATLSFGYRW
ncbi:TonB-dependent siderophore receptor [Uruburuella testudinis]|uniref:TonB-dependent siderophore receptor n=1 Tax=Uruburuella testudinis TaxID=1282863 RepID=A0ABY4DW81_9NEIS|nr:TonB-dependent siderophore receptor [Uruburuella testudinis]UOO83078.1 TonB-dependent siderophore receptor [Uruburuella testudinis]